MEDTDTKVRRTRSASVKSTPPAKTAKISKGTPKGEGKPASRRTKKKVVLMEVEVSDDEEEAIAANNSGDEKSEVNENEAEDKLLASPEASNDATDVQDKKQSETGELNGDNATEDKSNADETLNVVFNDIEMIQTEEELVVKSSELPQETTEESNKKIDDVAEVKIAEKTTEIKTLGEKITENETSDEKTTKIKTSDEKTADIKISDKKTREIKASDGKTTEIKTSDEKTTEIKASDDKITEIKTTEIKPPDEKNTEIETPSKKRTKVESVTPKEAEKQEVKEPEEKKTATLVVELEKTPETEKMIDEKEKEEITEMEVDLQDKKSEEKVEAIENMEVDADEEKKTKEIAEKSIDQKQNGDPDAENISEDELPGVPVVKVPEAEEVSDEELPGPKRAELPADTEVVSEDELPSVKNESKKEGTKRKLNETDDYDPGSPTSESEAPAKKPSLEKEAAEKEEKPKPKKLPELDKYWKAVNDDPTDFTGWTYLLQYVDQENDMEAAREAYDAFLSHYPYCYGYWRKYADYEKRKGNKKKCEEVFERGLKAIPLSVDLWIHYLTYVKTTRTEEEEFIRSQFERALTACGLEFRSDRLWDSYIKWETEGKRLQKVTGIYDRLLTTPTQGYTAHFDNFQEHVASNPPNKVIDVDEFLALRKEVRNALKHDTPPEAADSDAPPGDDDQSKSVSSDEETKSIRERIVSIRRKIHKSTVNAVTARWNYEEGIKRPYFHVKPLERCQLKNWHDYLDYETEQADKVRIIVLFERCLIACALYEEFWLKFVHYLESLKDPELQQKIRDVYERACTIHHLKKPNLHLQWAMFEENMGNASRAAEVLVNLEKSVPNVLQIAYRRINLERRRGDHEKCSQLYEHYISNSKNKMISSNIAIKYSRFCFRVLKDIVKAQEVLKAAITKDLNNPRLYLQLIDLTLQKDDVTESEVVDIIDSFLEKETTEVDQKTLFAQRKLEYLEDFGSDIQSVQVAYENYQKLLKLTKENNKKKEVKSEAASSVAKKEKPSTQASSQSSTYSNYGQYGGTATQPPYGYSGQQGQYNYSQYGQNEQYQYQNWQYPQGGYGGYNQWGGYSGGYGY